MHTKGISDGTNKLISQNVVLNPFEGIQKDVVSHNTLRNSFGFENDINHTFGVTITKNSWPIYK